MALKIGYQGRAVCRAAFLTADGIDMQINVLKSKSADNRSGKRNSRCIRSGIFRAEGFGSELEELTASARLRLLMAEAGNYIVILKRHSVRALTVLNYSSCYRSSSLGAKRNRAALISILESIHLLLNDVGSIADTAHEELGILKGGSSYLTVTVLLRLFSHHALYVAE